MPRKLNAKRLDEFRRHNLAWLLLRVRSDFFDRVGEQWRKHGYSHDRKSTRAAIMALLPLEGARLKDLAIKAGVTKQGMAQIVDDVEAQGWIERFEDPNDRRAKIVRFTDEGLELLQDAQQVVAAVWKEYEGMIGSKKMNALRDSLDALEAAIEEEALAEAADAD